MRAVFWLAIRLLVVSRVGLKRPVKKVLKLRYRYSRR